MEYSEAETFFRVRKLIKKYRFPYKIISQQEERLSQQEERLSQQEERLNRIWKHSKSKRTKETDGWTPKMEWKKIQDGMKEESIWNE